MSQRPEWRDILVGIGVSFFMNVAFVFVSFILIYLFSSITTLSFLSNVLSYGIVGIGLSQLLYVVPTAIDLKRKQKWGEMKGVIIGAIITALLSGGCFLLLASFIR